MLQETDTARIVQKRYRVLFFLPLYDDDYIIARERKTKLGWKVTSYLYAKQCDDLNEYVEYFDWNENSRNNGYGSKQFKATDE